MSMRATRTFSYTCWPGLVLYYCLLGEPTALTYTVKTIALNSKEPHRETTT